MVNQAKQVAINPRDQASASRWRDTNDRLLDSVRGVGDAITGLPSRRATPQQQPQRFENNVHVSKKIEKSS